MSTRTLDYSRILLALILVLEILIMLEHQYATAEKTQGLLYRPRMRSRKISQNLTEITRTKPKDSLMDNGRYEIRSVSGEPDYKSVNLTWEVEFVPLSNGAGRTNSSNFAEASSPPKAFQIFFCELQSFGPHRCRSKLVNESAMVPGDEVNNRQLRHFKAQIDNLRMATKYSFHIRPQAKFGRMKISARSGLFDNEIEDENGHGRNEANQLGEQTIIIPTKGFSAQATKCLPHASEIEVETGPYFGGKIVVDGRNCGVKGDPDDPKDKYTMRIDHKECGSLVKSETNTVETFITVQENLGIFTHSTRRFVVVCSFQSGMQTVRASFMVPGRDGMAAAMDNDPFEPDDQTRLGREQRHMRYVDKSALILKEPQNGDEDEVGEETKEPHVEAQVKEIPDPARSSVDAVNSVATLEGIMPGINEEDIKHESNSHSRRDLTPFAHAHARAANYAKLMVDAKEVPDEVNESARGYVTTLHTIAGSIGSAVLTVSLTVIIFGVVIFIAYREIQRRRGVIKQNLKLQQQQPQQPQSSQHQPHQNHQKRCSTKSPQNTLPKQQVGTM